MPKGRIYGSSELKLREAIAYLHGRIERDIELFASAGAFQQMELAQGLGALLLGIGERPAGAVPNVQMAARDRGSAASEMEGLVESHGGRASSRRSAGARKTAPRKVKSSGIGAYWKAMTPEERSREMQRRMKVAKKKAAEHAAAA